MGPTFTRMIQARDYRIELESTERLQHSLRLGDERAYECVISWDVIVNEGVNVGVNATP